ncbi:MAG: hypothetical protein MUE81_21340 [Thermoflexibacter sp.]|jgi:hypothetical protein|nr:hypothetical protein [Thermoflexibacter sp.]
MNKISEVIGKMEKPNFPFKPSPDFYDLVGIKRKRFWQLYRKEVSPNMDEIKAIADYFKVKPNDLINL